MLRAGLMPGGDLGGFRDGIIDCFSERYVTVAVGISLTPKEGLIHQQTGPDGSAPPGILEALFRFLSGCGEEAAGG
jgi:hypothetical protein